MLHDLKADSEPFHAVRWGRKTLELREYDRGFSVGDQLRLHETRFTGEQMKNEGLPLVYTGLWHECVITHILRGPAYGLREGWALLSIADQAVNCPYTERGTLSIASVNFERLDEQRKALQRVLDAFEDGELPLVDDLHACAGILNMLNDWSDARFYEKEGQP